MTRDYATWVFSQSRRRGGVRVLFRGACWDFQRDVFCTDEATGRALYRITCERVGTTGRRPMLRLRRIFTFYFFYCANLTQLPGSILNSLY